MTIEELSVFIENRTGQLSDVTDTLANAGINLRALNIAETSDYGVLRLITDEAARAAEILKSAGFIVTVKRVFAISVPDRPGGLAEVVRMLSAKHVDIAYIYSMFGKNNNLAYMIFCAKDEAAMEAAIRDCGLDAISPEVLFGE